MGKHGKLKIEVMKLAKSEVINGNSGLLLKKYDIFKNKYPNLPYATYRFLVTEVCRTIKDNIDPIIGVENYVNRYDGFKDELLKVAKSLNYNAKELYKMYNSFVELYPNLKYSTFSRYVRRACSKKESIYNPDALDSQDIENYIENIIKNDKISTYKSIDRIKFQKDTTKHTYKRMVVLSDLHCGHILGLTPPSWQFQSDNIELGHIAEMQREGWNWYMNAIKRVGKNIDILVINGDLIDGRGDKSGSTELITSDRARQISIGVECVEQWDANQVFMTRGTPYHTGNHEQFEDLAAEKLGAYIDNSLDIKVNGKLFNFRHKVAGSTVPHGKATAVIKESFWNLVQSAYNEVPFADVVIRSHVHYMMINQDSMRYSITTPALQLNSRYGQQQCTGLTDFGFLVIDIYDNGHIIINPCVAKLELDVKKNVIEL